MKQGDKVILFDGSHSLELINNKLKNTRPAAPGKPREWVVIAVSCKLPADSDTEVNDCIIRQNQRIVFTQQRFLKLLRYCAFCGHEL